MAERDLDGYTGGKYERRERTRVQDGGARVVGGDVERRREARFARGEAVVEPAEKCGTACLDGSAKLDGLGTDVVGGDGRGASRDPGESGSVERDDSLVTAFDLFDEIAPDKFGAARRFG